VALGFDAVVTGHYARLETGTGGEVELHRAVDAGKDQSYVLGVLSQEQLRHSMFPLGDTPKGGVRAEAAERGLAVADKPDSHDICFIPDGDTAGFLRRQLGSRPGTVINVDGEPVGAHDGTYAFTVGQRRGLRIGRPAPDGKPRYVLDIEPVSGTVTVGPREALEVRRIEGIRPLWCGGGVQAGPVEGAAQLRAHGEPFAATATVIEDRLVVDLHEPATGVAPGQSVVVYDGTRVVGSATIASAAA
jgi:tRNA-specific 2-thiouridylase